ncbi:MAG TPA: methionyl-tRNA formyltransferase [Phycisphaerae bacterium]|jgi:methionyl-tRNA formyltransferase
MRIVLFASGEFALPTLRWLCSSPYEVARVVTQPDRLSGRGRRPTPTAVRELAEQYHLPVLASEDVNAPAVLDDLARLSARLGLVIAFGQKLGSRLTVRAAESASTSPAVFRCGCVNLHASLLPRHRGAAPVNYAILSGDEETGVTVFRLTERIDAGDILETRRTRIREAETADELHDRLAEIGVEAVQAALGLFENKQEPVGTPQPLEGATRAPKLRKEDGWIDFARPARDVANQIRGLWSWPGAACDYVSKDGLRRERVILARARASEPQASAGLPPGTLDGSLLAAAGTGAIEILEIKPASGRLMSWRDFVNGHRVAIGDRFVTITARPAA